MPDAPVVCTAMSSASCSCGDRPLTDSSESSAVAVDYDASWGDDPQGPCRASARCDCASTTACGADACDCASGGGRVAAPLSLQSVASTLEHVQGAMCKINRKMSKTGRAVAQVVRRLRYQGQKVQRLQNRLRAVEPKLNLCAQQQALACADIPPAAPPPYPGCCCAPLDFCASCPACPQPCPDAHAHAHAHAHVPCGREGGGGRSRSRPHAPSLQRQPCLPTHAPLHCRRSCYTVPPPCVVQRPSCCKAFACAPVASSPSCAWGRPPAQCACAAPRGGEPPSGCDAPFAHCASPLARRLFKMAHDGRAEDVWNLLVAGADVNCLNSSKWTPLHRAAAQGRVCVVAMLLEWGARVDAQTSYGHAPLHLAAAHDCSGRCAEVLLRAGADANCVTRALQTPLHLAAHCGNAAAVQVLLRAGARPCTCDDEGRTPYDVAKGCCRRLLRACSRRPHRTSSCYADSLRCSDTLYAY